MTKEEIRSAVSMRIDGYTWKSIANQLHYSDVTVRESISKLIQSPRKTSGGKFMYVIFPNVRSWMRDRRNIRRQRRRLRPNARKPSSSWRMPWASTRAPWTGMKRVSLSCG